MMNRTMFAVLLAAGTTLAGPAFAECTLHKIGSFPVRLEGTVPMLPATVRGEAVELVAATGDQLTLVDRATATRLNLPLDDQSNIRAYGGGKEVKIEFALMKDFAIGSYRARSDMKIGMAPEYWLPQGAAGRLGNDFWSRVDTEFDLANKVVNLYQPQGCSGGNLAYWAANADQVQLGGLDQYRPTVQVEINGVPMRAIVDSAQPYTVVGARAARRLGIDPSGSAVEHVGEVRGRDGLMHPVAAYGFQSFKIGEEEIRNPRIAITDLDDESHKETGSNKRVELEYDVRLGSDWLNAHRVYLSNSEHKMFFTYDKGKAFRAPTSMRTAQKN